MFKMTYTPSPSLTIYRYTNIGAFQNFTWTQDVSYVTKKSIFSVNALAQMSLLTTSSGEKLVCGL